MRKENIKYQIENDSLTFLLSSVDENDLLPKESIANIVACDKFGKLIWTIDLPTTKYDFYVRMYFKVNVFFALTNGGQLHKIDKRTGKILESKMIK